MKVDSVEKESVENIGFDEAFETYKDAVVQTAALYTRNQYEAEDIAQETFLRYFVYIQHNKEEKPKSWLMAVARNLACNYLKKYHREIPIDMMEDGDKYLDKESSPEDIFFDNMWRTDNFRATNTILDALYHKNRKWYDAVTFAYCLKRPQKEVAASMEISEDALQGLLRRAKKWMGKNYQKEYEEIIGK